MSCIRNFTDQHLVECAETMLSEERRSLVDFLRLLEELDFRELPKRRGHGSTFRYCVDVFRLSEQQAYLRINVARLGRRFPVIFDRIAAGTLHMSGVSRMSAALSLVDEPEALIDAATGKTRREIEALVAQTWPMPDPKRSVQPDPISPGRWHLSTAIGARSAQLIDQARDLGAPADLEALIEEALVAYVQKLMNRKLKGTSAPGRQTTTATKVAVYVREGGQCTYVGDDGRCTEMHSLQFDHVRPIALGGKSNDPDNIRLLCPGHNQLAARQCLDPHHVELRAQGFTPVRRS